MSAVVDSFAREDWQQLAAAAGVNVDELVAARETFVAAGTAAIHGLSESRRWLQCSISVDKKGWEQLVTGDLQDSLAAWLEHDPDRGFFFVFKDPGLRVRFLGIDDDCARTLALRLDDLVNLGLIGWWRRGPYDAEVAQFGGPVGLELAHQFFTAESLAVLAHHRLRLTGAATIGPERLSLILIDRLLRQLTDPWERWDVWCKMTLTGRIDDVESAVSRDSARARATLMLDRQDELLDGAGAEEQALVARYDAAMKRLTPRVQAAVENGRLCWGLREVLPFWIIFHWNRMLLSTQRQRQLCALMVRALSPKNP